MRKFCSGSSQTKARISDTLDSFSAITIIITSVYEIYLHFISAIQCDTASVDVNLINFKIDKIDDQILLTCSSDQLRMQLKSHQWLG